MNFTIRRYVQDDYPMVTSWYEQAQEIVPVQDQLPLDSTFLLLIDGEPSIMVSLFISNMKAAAQVDNLISKKGIDENVRRHAISYLHGYISCVASMLGYKHLLCLSVSPGLSRRYEELGYNKTAENITSFMREI